MTGAVAAMISGTKPAIVIALTPAGSVSGYNTGSGIANVATGSVLATATGGSGTPTYAWTQVGFAPYSWTISAPSAASTYFTAQSLPQGVATNTTFMLTVTDALGTVATAQISATARNNDNYSGGGLDTGNGRGSTSFQ